MDATPSTPACLLEQPLEYYCEGGCQELAVALHRNLGWEIVLVIQPDEPYWEDEEDSDNFIASVVHAYAVDPAGNAWDIQGVRPAAKMQEEAKERFLVWSTDTDWVANESDLATYVGEWGEPEPIDRPLFAYTDGDIERAWRDAQRALGNHPGWPSPASARSRPRM